MKNRFLSLAFLIVPVCGNAQESYETLKDSAVLEAIFSARQYAVDSLHLQTGNDFYAWEVDSLTGHIKARTVKEMYCYVYAWDPRTKKSPLPGAFQYFDTNAKAAQHFSDSLKKAGHETMLYKTAGTSAARLTSRMLQYSVYSIRYIILHEAVHRHRGNTNSGLPYIFEEALCDLVADWNVPVLMRWVEKGVDSMVVFHGVNQNIHWFLYDAINGDISLKSCNKSIRKTLKKGDAFQNDRFGYKVNHAYLERYTSYCKYYYLLKRVLLHMKDQEKFLDAVFALKGTEEEVKAALQLLEKK